MAQVRGNFCLWSVSGAARNETWHVDDNWFRSTDAQPWACALSSHACSRDEMWSWCATLLVLYLWVYLFTPPPLSLRRRLAGGFFPSNRNLSKQWEKSPHVRTWRVLRIPIARLPLGLVPRWRRWRPCLHVGPRDADVCKFLRDPL